MADTTTELEVLDQIVDVLGGQSGQYETVVPTLQQILALLGGGGGSGSGYNPSLSVGRADALTGADSTAQWSQRVTEGSGAATVRSVQGAAVAWNQLLTPWSGSVSGLTFTANSGRQVVSGTASAASNTRTSSAEVVVGHKYLIIAKAQEIANAAIRYYRNSAYITGEITDTSSWTAGDRIGVGISYESGAAVSASYYPQLFDLTAMFGSGNEPTTVAEFERMFPASYYPYSAPTLKPVQIAGIQSKDSQGGELDSVEWTAQTLRAAGSVADVLYSDHVDVNVGERAYQSGDESDATVRTDGTTTYYPLTTPTTTPISPALPMTYRVQQGGSESIVVPEGEISAIPVLTIAEGESAADVVMDALAAIAAPDGPTATANHSVGTYLTMGGKLYKVTSAIAVGESIAAGTNVSQTTVMAELLALTA